MRACIRACICAYSLTREAPVELATCNQSSVVPVKVPIARPDVHPLVLVKLLAPLEEGLDASTVVIPGGGLPREVLEGLCQRGDGLCVGPAIQEVRVEGCRGGMYTHLHKALPHTSIQHIIG